MTPGQRKAARRPGVGGKKPGLWPNVWKKRHREATGRGGGRKHTQSTKDKISRALRRGNRTRGMKSSRG